MIGILSNMLDLVKPEIVEAGVSHPPSMGNHLIKLCCYRRVWKTCKAVGREGFKDMRFHGSLGSLPFKNCLQLFLIVIYGSQGRHLLSFGSF